MKIDIIPRERRRGRLHIEATQDSWEWSVRFSVEELLEQVQPHSREDAIKRIAELLPEVLATFVEQDRLDAPSTNNERPHRETLEIHIAED